MSLNSAFCGSANFLMPSSIKTRSSAPLLPDRWLAEHPESKFQMRAEEASHKAARRRKALAQAQQKRRWPISPSAILAKPHPPTTRRRCSAHQRGTLLAYNSCTFLASIFARRSRQADSGASNVAPLSCHCRTLTAAQLAALT
jgi:hypothetical protein